MVNGQGVKVGSRGGASSWRGRFRQQALKVLALTMSSTRLEVPEAPRTTRLLIKALSGIPLEIKMWPNTRLHIWNEANTIIFKVLVRSSKVQG